jgi:hypothetical protein
MVHDGATVGLIIPFACRSPLSTCGEGPGVRFNSMKGSIEFAKTSVCEFDEIAEFCPINQTTTTKEGDNVQASRHLFPPPPPPKSARLISSRALVFIFC